MTRKIFRYSSESAYKAIAGGNRSPEKLIPEIPKTTPSKVDLSDYLYLPDQQLYVAKNLSHQGKNWYDAHKALAEEGAFMPTIRLFIDFLDAIRSGKVLDNGERDPVVARSLYDSIVEGNEKKYEWLDANFRTQNGIIHLVSDHRVRGGEISQDAIRPLIDGYVKNGGHVDLFSANIQGLPTKLLDTSPVRFWHPAINTDLVAWFGQSYLACGAIGDGGRDYVWTRAVRKGN